MTDTEDSKQFDLILGILASVHERVMEEGYIYV